MKIFSWKVGAIAWAVSIIVLAAFLGAKVADANLRARTADSERNAVVHWVDMACEAAGAPFRQPKNSGDACLVKIRELVKFKADTMAETDRIRREAEEARSKKQAADIKRAKDNRASVDTAIQHMETTNEQVQDDRVGADWFRAFNELAGLRSPRRDPAPAIGGGDGR